VQVESSHLDISSFSYDFTKFSTIFHFWKKKTNQNRDGLKLNRPALQARFRPTRGPAKQPEGEAGADTGAPPVMGTEAGERLRRGQARRRRLLRRNQSCRRVPLVTPHPGIPLSPTLLHRRVLDADEGGWRRRRSTTTAKPAIVR
jgi:hypothetical protein